ncbi:peptide ABC transporter substrate-binding protein [Palleronia sp. LCG004]|uniref:peptide ABC transporter substrate-binding protein n=1 Tax=Palleronia sp. LCG004 TaxID=3079304 RepID=UPI00294287DB|nr:peptide ABC transporter substrate-binding protein [Palleronia sp. LCG004]WOI55721.1 peptide ABC transporter substrate-binding protein [Palleronia sp. LCG004]
MRHRAISAATRLSGTAMAALLAASPLIAADVPEGVELAEDQTFSYRELDQPASFDPQLVEGVPGAHVVQQLFEGLMIQDDQGELIPGVATGYEGNEDNTEFTFTLREDARWSNGDPVTAEDFVYAWRRAADPATASEYAWFVELAGIENAAEIIAGEADPETLGVEAVDDRTFRVSLSEPKPYFPQMTAHTTFAPTHRATVEEFGDAWTDPANIVSNGAYVLQNVQLNEYWNATKNPEYWDADNVVIDEVVSYIINDTSQALTRWEAGEFDMLEPVPAGSYPRLQEQYPDAAHSVPRLCSYYYEVNQREDAPEALRDPNVRRALSLAIDRSVITDQLLQGGQSPAFFFTPEATAGFEPPEIDYASMSQAERDEEASRLIEEAGYDDLSFDLLYNTDESHRQIATVIGQMWRQKLGVDITLVNQEWATYLDNKRNGNFDIARSAWCGDYNEASTFLDTLGTDIPQNSGRWSNDEFDNILSDAATSEDPQQNYQQAEQILSQEMGILPIYHYTNTFLLEPTLKGFPLGNVENNWYVKDFYRIAEE